MPVYCYRRIDNDEIVELVMSVAEFQLRTDKDRCVILEDGTKAKLDIGYQAKGIQSFPDNYPQESDALGVHPSQIKQATEQAKRLGVPTEFSSDGSMIWRDKKHRKEICEALGYYDRNAGFSDPTPKYR